MAQNPLDDIVNELVVFKHEDGTFVSNSPMWNDSRIRDRWVELYGPNAKVDNNEDGIPDEDEEDEVPDYNTWTNDQLRAELLTRELSLDGKKVDMVARLVEDDAQAE
jgi:hypothetical protein